MRHPLDVLARGEAAEAELSHFHLGRCQEQQQEPEEG